MNSALQELFRQLQQHELSVAEFELALNELCMASPDLAKQAVQLLDVAVTSELMSVTQSQQIRNALSASAGQVPATTHSDVFMMPEPYDSTVGMVSTPETVKTTLQRDAAANAEAASFYEKTAPIIDAAAAQKAGVTVEVGTGSIIKDRFILKEKIGSGGMGVVYAAVDQRKVELHDPKPMVALKILGGEFAQHPQALMALQREARKAQELAHPNIITVYDFDRDGDLVYMTMELLKGRSLDTLIREVRGKGIERNAAMSIIQGIAEGLAYAHRKGIVHSDLKPANIFLSGRDNTPKLLDFGIARAIPNREATLYGKDMFDAGTLGAYTLPYATEEMIAGVDPHPSDDLYALGLMCCELLSGEHPFKRQSAVEARKQGMKPTPIKGLSKQEWQTIESCLSFDRDKRPKDAGAFLRAMHKKPSSNRGLIAASVALVAIAAVFAYATMHSKKSQSHLVDGSSNAGTDTSTPSMAREVPDPGKLEHVPVTSYGQGPTLQAAVDQALQLAMEQINGKFIDSSSTQFQGGLAVAFGPDPMQLSSASFANYVTTQSRGTVTDFRIVEKEQVDGGYAVTIHAKVAKFTKPASANRLRVVVAPLRLNSNSFVLDTRDISSQTVSGEIHKRIFDALVQSNRVAALDREFNAELDSEIDVIASGRTASEDQAKLTQQLVADYVLVATLEKFEYRRFERHLRLTERTLVSNAGKATLSMRLINVATRRAEFAGTTQIVIPETDPTTLQTGNAIDHDRKLDAILENMIDQLSSQSVSKVLGRLYPVTILSVEGDDVVLSQGEGIVHDGATYQVILRGKEMKDPQTGQSLGRIEKPCCTIRVNRVTPSLSYATLMTKDVDVAKSFVPGALELGAMVNTTSTQSSASSVTASPELKSAHANRSSAAHQSSSSKADNNW